MTRRRETPWIHTMWGVRWTAIIVGACIGVTVLGGSVLLARGLGAL